MAIEIRETDGLDNSAKSWKLRLKREKQRSKENAIAYTAKLKALKVQQ